MMMTASIHLKQPRKTPIRRPPPLIPKKVPNEEARVEAKRNSCSSSSTGMTWDSWELRLHRRNLKSYEKRRLTKSWRNAPSSPSWLLETISNQKWSKFIHKNHQQAATTCLQTRSTVERITKTYRERLLLTWSINPSSPSILIQLTLRLHWS